MQLMKIRNLKKSFGEHELLKGIDLDLFAGDRIGLTGHNGTGKTTLAKIVAGKMKRDEGSADTFGRKVKIGYLQQSADYTEKTLKRQYTSGEWLKLAKLLGISHLDENRNLAEMSGGERLKLALANVLLEKPDLLILDEPTNHMDLHGVEWLTEKLKEFDGTAIIISHDRYFLDVTATRMEELADGKLISYSGNYTAYREEKKRRFEQQEKEFEKQQRYKKRIEGQMEKLKNWSEKAHRESTKNKDSAGKLPMGYKEHHRVKAKKMDIQVRSKMNRLNAELEKNKVEKPKEEAHVYFQFDAASKRGKRILEGADACKAFGSRVLFEKSSFYLKYGEKAALMGPNGSGKTTFLRILLGSDTLTSGTVWISETLKIGYLSQEAEDLDESLTPIEALGLSDNRMRGRAMEISAQLGMASSMEKKIGFLSLGQRTRVKLIGLLLQELDILILDEPTNHLDLPAREQLEETLSQFAGTLLIVSHDRYFLHQLADCLLVIGEDQVIRRYGMTLKEYESPGTGTDNRKEELLIVETKLSEVLGKLSLHTPLDREYTELDLLFKQLLRRKKELSGKL
ncbi:ATP-binding cassette domain-containing protein [Bacillus mangrovi]|uniref:ATP-binding cassette domain-containing protein n=1 Tax=Metabacillus mangrovi TaxID=1491830 RepID=A0A7X2S3Y0_9BACI|nr:ABC-F family ATP-binding cassette domain-containing protein [Metabacillus mangrovi]MTH53060.1 ATP-binding cassette domain-containing protein [Metabacillus mangrovi]